MQAFHNDPSLKEALINQLQAHYDADEIVKGVYWENGKGCAIGCAIHSSDHKLYEKKFDIPEWLARVQDRIFECLPNDKAKEWPILFSKSVNVGSNLENIKIPFLIFVVESTLDKFNHEKFPEVKKSVDNVIHLLKNNPDDKKAEWAAADAAASAAKWAAEWAAAEAAKWTAARAAEWAAEWAAAEAAAEAAKWAARAAEWAAEWGAGAARAAEWAAEWAAGAAGAAEWSAAYEKFANKLIELIENCK